MNQIIRIMIWGGTERALATIKKIEEEKDKILKSKNGIIRQLEKFDASGNVDEAEKAVIAEKQENKS